MDGFKYIEDHFETTVKPRILEQYKESGRWQACLEAVVRKLQKVEDTAFSISKAIDFKSETPTGEKLDWLAGLINVKRLSGESDQAFFLRFVSMCGANTAGTPDNVVYNAALLSGDTAPQYMDEDNPDDPLDVAFLVYTPNGRQILQAKVRKLAPAGVLGIAGAAIGQGDGSLLADADGKLFLMAAEDANIGTGSLLVAESDGTRLVAEDGVTQLIPEA